MTLIQHVYVVFSDGSCTYLQIDTVNVLCRSQLQETIAKLMEEIEQQQESMSDLRTQVDSANSQREELQERIQTIIAERVRAAIAHAGSRHLDVGQCVEHCACADQTESCRHAARGEGKPCQCFKSCFRKSIILPKSHKHAEDRCENRAAARAHRSSQYHQTYS